METENNSSINKNEEKKKLGIGLKFLITFLIICIIIGVFFFIGYLTKIKPSPPVSATIDDITISTSETYSTNINYSLIPKKNIDNLSLGFMFFDKNENVVTVVYKEIGNVKERMQYIVNINLGENISYLDISQITYSNIFITKGTIA